jgi:hypothetical protein
MSSPHAWSGGVGPAWAHETQAQAGSAFFMRAQAGSVFLSQQISEQYFQP